MIDFIFYTLFIIFTCSIFLLSISIKNEINETQLEIRQLNASFLSQSDEVKSLQSTRNYFTSYDYIQKTLKNRMVSATPETLFPPDALILKSSFSIPPVPELEL